MRASKSSCSIGQVHTEGDERQLRRSRTRSSLDTFIIHGRTRIPSSRNPPEPIDLQITTGLLNPRTCSVPSTSDHKLGEQVPEIDQSQLVHPLKIHRFSQPRPFAFDGPGSDEMPSTFTSATWTTVSNRVFTDSSGRSADRESADFVDEYNRLAQKHGMPALSGSVEPTAQTPEQEKDKDVSVRPQRSSWLLRKFIRRAASTHSINHAMKKPLTRTMSITDILDRGRKDTLKDKTLEELARLGGVSIFTIPPAFAAARLAIPTCFAATATYLYQHGRTTPGIFRVPGQVRNVNALYDHYARQVENAEKDQFHVQQTIRSGVLPTHITQNVHDVASAFKKFIAGLPGGILGSMPLLKTLKDINTLLHPSPDLAESQKTTLRARLIALAIASLASDYQTALLSAVLGLTALVARAAEQPSKGNGNEPASSNAGLMTSRCLGVVFGPLLLGNKTEEIDLSQEHNRGSLLVVPKSPQKQRKDKKTKSPKKLERERSLALNVERAKVTASIMEMLVRDWEHVVRQFRNIGVTELQYNVAQSKPKAHNEARELSSGSNSADEATSSQSSSNPKASLRVNKSRLRSRSSLESFVMTRKPSEARDRSGSSEEPSIIAERNSNILSPSQETLHTVRKPSANEKERGQVEFRPIASLDPFIGSPVISQSQDIKNADAVCVENLDKNNENEDLRPDIRKSHGQDQCLAGKISRRVPDWDFAGQLKAQSNQESLPTRPNEGIEDLGFQRSEQQKIHEYAQLDIHNLECSTSSLHLDNDGQAKKSTNAENEYEEIHANHIGDYLPGNDYLITRSNQPDGGLEPSPNVEQASPAPNETRSQSRTFSNSQNNGIPIRQSSLSRSAAKRVVSRTQADEPLQRSTSLSGFNPNTGMQQLATLPRSYTISSAPRSNSILPYGEEPPVAHHMQFRSSTEPFDLRSTMPIGQEVDFSTNSRGNSTLYAEIRRLQRQVELRTEEAVQAHRQLEAMRDYRDSGTLSEKLREVQRGLKTWKNRAEWAERRLLMHESERRKSFAAPDFGDYALVEEREMDLRRATMI